MKTTRPWRFVSIATLATVLWCFAGFDQVQAHGPGGFGEPFIGGNGIHLVQFVGTLYPPEQKEKVARMNTITMRVKNKEWLFSIKRAMDLSGDLDQFEILENIWPPILTLRGPDNLIDSLLKPDIAGKRLAIHGTLYISDITGQLSHGGYQKERKQGKEKLDVDRVGVKKLQCMIKRK